MASVVIEHVVKSFDKTPIVNDVSLEINKGELFFILGPSGCGKTTLLRLIAGFYYPEKGRIFLADRDISQLSPNKRDTAMVFQSYALWPHMSVKENVSFGLELRHIGPKELNSRITNALEMVQMLRYADRRPNQLSGGQLQRVAIARALVLEPAAVLFDEPLSNLDAKLRLEMREQIRRIHDKLDLTMIYVTHDQAEALSMADRIAVMKDGQISQVGTARELYNQPANSFVAGFIGETNWIKGNIKAIGDTLTVQTPVGELSSLMFDKKLKMGDSVICSIRPESLNIVSNTKSFLNTIEGKVRGVFYFGSYEQYFVELMDETEMKVLGFDIGSAKVKVGETVTVGFDQSKVIVLQDEN